MVTHVFETLSIALALEVKQVGIILTSNIYNQSKCSMKNEDNIKDHLHKQCKGVFCHCTNSPCDGLCRMVQSWSLHWKLDIILLAIKILKVREITKTQAQRFINICEIAKTTVCERY